MKDEQQYFCGETYEGVLPMCVNGMFQQFYVARSYRSLKIEGKHVRKGSRWAPRELSGELYDKILRLFAAVMKS